MMAKNKSSVMGRVGGRQITGCTSFLSYRIYRRKFTLFPKVPDMGHSDRGPRVPYVSLQWIKCRWTSFDILSAVTYLRSSISSANN